MQPSVVLIHSPFLGPETWRSTGRAMTARGRDVRVPSLLAVARSSPPFWPAGVEAIVRAAGDGPVVLVPHSNAGLYVPAVVDALGEQVRGVVFVDAALPSRGHYTPPEFLRRLPVTDGLLPSWTSWWDEADVAALFPDPAMRAAVESEQPRMPSAYYDHLPPIPSSWPIRNGGYLWFGRPYDAGLAEAESYGWPTAHVPGTHLHMLADPQGVADAVLEMAARWQ
jgi:pimeloyl-ACP methyl ester carboxylesterase